MSSRYTVDTVKETVKLLREYESQKMLCAAEFINSQDLKNISKEVCTMFFNLMKHKFFLDKLIDHLLEQCQLNRCNKWGLECLLYIVMFILSPHNYEDIKCIFLEVPYKFSVKVVQFLIQEENQVLCARAGCKYFDKDYIINNVIHPLLVNGKLLKKMEKELTYEFNEREVVMRKDVTTPVTPTVLRKKIVPQPPVDLQVTENKFQAIKVPDYKKQEQRLQKSLVKMKDRNWNKALKLYEEAQICAFKCATSQKPKIAGAIEEKYTFRSTRLQKFKTNVPIRKTNACLMREAAALVKCRESEIKRLEELLHGSFDSSKIQAIEEELRNAEQQQHLQDIQQKHLEGLLTFEEAQIAKKRVLQINKENMEKFKEERVRLMQQLFDWKEIEREKIKKLVEKSHYIEKSAKEAEQKLLEEKQARAKLIDYESKNLLQEIQRKREEELADKMKLIQEFRTLHQLHLSNAKFNNKQFDPTDCPSFGLLCEMSIAELRERLNLLKVEMQEELEERKKLIIEERKRKDNLIDNVKKFILKSRTPNCKPAKTASSAFVKLEETAEILALREKLKQAKQTNSLKY